MKVDTAQKALLTLLVLRAQAGERDAAELLVQHWNLSLLSHARRMTGDEDAARDVAQEAWLGILRGLRRLDDPERFAAWSFQIVSRKAAEWVRTKVRRHNREREQLHEPEARSIGPECSEDDVLRQALRALPIEQQSILHLRYVDDFSIDEIAEALDVAAGTVKSRLFHARQHLRAIMERRNV
jgi:RNA polymerase sigma-70 factor, ECF subfamily